MGCEELGKISQWNPPESNGGLLVYVFNLLNLQCQLMYVREIVVVVGLEGEMDRIIWMSWLIEKTYGNKWMLAEEESVGTK